MVAGVTSYGNGCGESIHAGVYTRISMYMDWIKSIVGKDCVVTTGENRANVGTMSRRTVTHAPVRTIFRYIINIVELTSGYFSRKLLCKYLAILSFNKSWQYLTTCPL
jgi:hypothetical protein